MTLVKRLRHWENCEPTAFNDAALLTSHYTVQVSRQLWDQLRADVAEAAAQLERKEVTHG